MKKVISLLFLFLIVSLPLVVSGQEDTDQIVSKENVTLDNVKEIFENAFYEITETSGSYFQIEDIFKIYIDLDKDNRYIILSVNWPIDEESMLEDRFELLNTIGKEVLLVTPYYNDDETSLIVKTTIWIEGGTTQKNIVMTEKLFVKALNLILDKDLYGIIL